jgi:hypothetical protein
MAYNKSEQAAFDAAQADEGFLAWVAMNEFILECEIDDDIPGLPPRPWGADALRIAERRALDLVARKEETFDEAHQEMSWRIVRFLGQTFVEAFEGRWVNVPPMGSASAEIAVELPFRNFYIEPMSLLTAAMKRRTGEEWARVFGYAEEDYKTYLVRDADPTSTIARST